MLTPEMTLHYILDKIIEKSVRAGGWDRWEDPSDSYFFPMPPGDWSYDGDGPEIIEVPSSQVPGFVAPVVEEDNEDPIKPYGDVISIQGPGHRVRGGSVWTSCDVEWSVRRIEVIGGVIRVAVTYESSTSEEGEPDEPSDYQYG